VKLAESPYFRASVARKVEAKIPGAAFPSGDGSNPEGSKYCAYNQDRQRFLCANVEVADFSTSLEARLPGVTPITGAGLWIAPIQKISPTSVRVPLDLVYLDCNSVVLDAVESFPISQTTALIASATSLLVLPSQTIGLTGTQPGDRLLLCDPDEMKLRLEGMSDPNVEARSAQGPASSPSNPSVNDRLNQNEVGNVLPWVDPSDAKAVRDLARTASAPVEIAATGCAPAVPVPDAPAFSEIAATAPAPAAAPQQPDQAPAPRWRATTSKNWWQRLLSPEPSDPRKAPRTALPWLVAYFFTGARPVAHGIRDISATGLYVFAEDRWYPGTVVRITLTDKRNPTEERSLTVNAEVIRSAEDGIGFQFVLKDGKDSRRASASGLDRLVQGVDRAEVEQFLLRMSSDTD
jgi:hypothetical protein